MQFGNECSVATLFVPVPLPSLSFCLFLILPFSAETLPKKKSVRLLIHYSPLTYQR